jgi:Transposase
VQRRRCSDGLDREQALADHHAQRFAVRVVQIPSCTSIIALRRSGTRRPGMIGQTTVRWALRSHRALFLNYLRAKKQLSGCVVEGVNNRAKLAMRKCFGFRIFRVTEIALYCRNLMSPQILLAKLKNKRELKISELPDIQRL